MCDGVAQHVFERRQHFVEHRPVEFQLRTTDFQIGSFADFLARLPNDTVKAVGNAGKRHHAYRHQFLLNLTVQARLRDDRRVGVVQVFQQILLDGGHIVDRFGHHPREFLEAREAIEFEWVEIRVVLAGLCRT